MAYSDLITMQELSPELRQLISMGGGGTSINGGMIVIDDIYTQKVEATIEEQTEFEIPFKQYDSVNSYLDIKINSTWINPSRYSIVDNKVVFNEGVPLGTFVYFTIFSLAQPTSDGGFIEDVEVAETPQEVIVYDGEIINEKVNEAVTGHNISGEAHADIRNEIKKNKVESVPQSPSTTSFNTLLSFALDLISKGCKTWSGVISGFTDLPQQDWGFHCNLQLTGGNVLATINKQQSGGQVLVRESNASNVWVDSWREVVDTRAITLLDSKIGVLETNRGYLTSKSLPNNVDLDTVTENGIYEYNQYGEYINAPSTVMYGYLIGNMVVYNGVGCSSQYIYPSYNGASILFRRKHYSMGWSEWQELATTSKINNLSLLNGWVLGTGEFVVYKNGNICNLNMEIKGGTIASQTVLFTLPSGYRPLSQVVVYAPVRNFSTGAIINERSCLISMDTNGNVRFSTTSLPQTGDAIGLNLTWAVA